MKSHDKRTASYLAAAIALMIGLTGCGSAASGTGATLWKEAPMASESAALMEKEKSGTESAGMMEKEETGSGNAASGEAGMDKESMAVTFEKNFALMDLHGNTVTLNEYEGKKVYVKFWGTWCSICRAGLDELEAIAAEQNAGMDAAVITIVAPGVNGEFQTDEFKAWYEKKGYTFPVLFDEGGEVLRDFQIRAFPTSIVFERDGSISTNRPGHIDNETLRELLGSEQ